MLMRGQLVSTILIIVTFSINAWSAAPADLTVYTLKEFSAEWGPGPRIKASFEELCQCKLRFVSFDDTGSMLTRLRLEGKRSGADVVIGLDTNYVVQAKGLNLFKTHKIDLSKVALPITWHDQYFIPYDYSYYAFIYDERKVKNPPKSFAELLKTDLRLIISDPRTSTPGLGLLEWVKAIYKERAGDVWRRLAPKIVTVTKNWGESYAMFRQGEADMVLSYVTSPAYHIINDNDQHYHAASFTEGHYLQIEVAAQLANAPHSANAERFMRFILSDSFQRVIPETYYMYPVTNIKLPAAYSGLLHPHTDLYFFPESSYEKRYLWLDEWLTAMRR